MRSTMILRKAMFAAVAIVSMASGHVLAAEVEELNLVDPDRGFSRAWRAYPDMDETFVRDGTPRSVKQVRSVAKGQTKRQLVQRIGQPISATRDGGWNFNIKLPLPQGNRLVCQYRVYFDAEERVMGSVWRRPQCADLVTGKLK